MTYIHAIKFLAGPLHLESDGVVCFSLSALVFLEEFFWVSNFDTPLAIYPIGYKSAICYISGKKSHFWNGVIVFYKIIIFHGVIVLPFNI